VRAALYDLIIVPLTASWYDAVLNRVPVGCRLLDVGIGTGGALVAHAEQLRAMEIHVTGVDIDADYIERCVRVVQRERLQAFVVPRLESVYDHRGGPYDAAYFSGSFMLLPDPPAAVRHVVQLLAPGGRLYFTQTFEHRRSRFLEVLKPLLRRLTTIDFGRVTYEADFTEALAAAGVAVTERVELHGSRQRSALLFVARPVVGNEPQVEGHSR
jgi:SAM-dependent methyltransferase